MRHRIQKLLFGLLLMGILHLAEGADPPVAAQVNSHKITVQQVQNAYDRAVGKRKIGSAVKEEFQRMILWQMVRRELLLQYLDGTKHAASRQEVEVAATQLGERLKRQGKTLAQYVRERNSSPDEFRRNLRFRISWQRYLKQYMTDENLERYFDKHRRDFDGTKLRVAHILLKPKSSPASSDERKQLMDRAKKIRQSITKGELSFSDAAKKYSDSPTGKQGGEVGWIGRDGPMLASFNKSAFALNVKEISEPIVSRFGVHLIRCLEEKKGELRWTQVDLKLRQAMETYLLEWMADQVKKKATIVYGKNWPQPRG